MKKFYIVLALLSLATSLSLAQNIGDQATAGFTNQRTYLNSDAGDLKPPLVKLESQTIDFTGIVNTGAESLAVFENMVLIGEGGQPTTYNLIAGEVLWSATITGIDAPLDYVPAFANDVVLLGGPATTTVKAIRVSTGATLWEDTSVGPTGGRYPLITDNTAIYHGQNTVVAANATLGPAAQTFWRHSTSTAQAPLAMFGRQVYLIQQQGIVQAIDLCSVGSPNILWVSQGSVGGDGSGIIATEKYVFVSNPTTGLITALSSVDGSVIWTRSYPAFGSQPMALAYDQLIVFFSDGDAVKVGAYDPDSGAAESIWEITDSSDEAGSADFGFVANNVVYFYNTSTNRIRALDAFTGTLIWSIAEDDVRALSIASNFFLVMTPTKLDVYDKANTVYLAQIADGQGAATLVTVNNLTTVANEVLLEFFDEEGDPLELEVIGGSGPASSVTRAIPAEGSVTVQTLGTSSPLAVGWARATGVLGPIAGTATFQFGLSGDLLYEAGVSDSPPTGWANVPALRQMTFVGKELSTGFAVANPLDETANLTLTYLRVAPTTVVTTIDLTLDALHHEDGFIQDLFPDDAIVGSEGTLIITSDIPIVVTALRTQNGYQMSSYPVGQPVK